MDVKFAHLWSLFFHLLILLGSYGNGVMEMDIGEIGSRSRNDEHNHAHVDMRIQQVHSHASSSHMHHIHKDPSFNVFFLMEDLKQGNTMPVYFPRREVDTSHFLSKEEADSIPFSSKDLHNLLDYFSISQGSPQAKAMEMTLRQCEANPMEGETKLCATSLESMLDFAQMICGKQVKIFSTTYDSTKSGAILQKYTLMGIQEIAAPKIVACHTMPYPYAIFFCHYSNNKNSAFTVSLTGENGDKVEALAVCHMDTSQWSNDHVAFRLLGVGPGSAPVCHFFPSDEFIWVPSISQA